MGENADKIGSGEWEPFDIMFYAVICDLYAKRSADESAITTTPEERENAVSEIVKEYKGKIDIVDVSPLAIICLATRRTVEETFGVTLFDMGSGDLSTNDEFVLPKNFPAIVKHITLPLKGKPA